MKIGDIKKSNRYGEYKIIKKINNNRYVIQFLKTGYIKEISSACIIKGEVRDPYYPIILDIACMGNVHVKENKYAFNSWKGMIQRCYDINNYNYKSYGGIGITVCDRWKCFEYYLEDLPLIPGYDEELYNKKQIVLDKDMRGTGKKQYSIENCMFVKQSDNFQEGLARRKQKTSSRYVGVTKLKDGKWQVILYYKGKYIYVGRYKTEKEAHAAYENKKQEVIKSY